jgi:VWFA-related protein
VKRLLALALLTVTLQAQHREEVTVEVVEVPVYVRTTRVPVEGLTRDRFELFVNGKPHPIDYFDVVDLGAPAPAAKEGEPQPPRNIRRRRLFLLLFDLVFSRPPALARARAAAAKLVNDAPDGDAFAVATHTRTAGVQFIVPFTTDRIAAGHAITKLRASAADDPMRLRITDTDREAVSAFMNESFDPSGAIADGRIEDPFAGGGEAMDDNRLQPMRRMVEHQVEDLGIVARRLGQLDGQKHVVVFSEGFNPTLVTGLQKKDRPSTASAQKGPPGANWHLIDLLHQMHRAFQSADAFLHAVDIAGLRHTWDPLVNDALNMLSRGTGGEFIRNHNDIAAALDRLEESHRYSYILGFRPRNASAGHNEVEVKIAKLPRGTTVSYRRGFSGTSPSSGVDGLRLADIITNDIPQHGIATELRQSSEGVVLKVPSSAWAGMKGEERPEVLLYVFDQNNVAVESRQIRLHPGAEHFEIPLDLKRGHVVKVLVKAGESLGFSRLAIAHPYL